MIVAELASFEELKKIDADTYLISIASLSMASFSLLSLSEAQKIIDSSNKPVFLNLNALYKDEDYPKIKKALFHLSGYKGIVFQDFGLVELVKEMGIKVEMIYDPITFITVKEDVPFFKNSGVTGITISSVLSMREVDDFKMVNEIDLAYHAFGYSRMFYSLRKHFTSFLDTNQCEELKTHKVYYLKEETRDGRYPAFEDDFGFYIYQDKPINIYDFMDHFKMVKYLFIDRLFIDQIEYIDKVNLFMGGISRDDYMKIYPFPFETGYLFRREEKGGQYV